MTVVAGPAHPGAARPPMWLVLATGLLAVAILAMAVAETSLWMHYLIDAGESISLIGLAFIAAAGLLLHRQGRLFASLPLALPWLLFPVITQGDQLIDHLSITWMRIVVHILLALIFGMPVALVVVAVRFGAAPRPGRERTVPVWAGILLPGVRQIAAGRSREGGAVLAASLLALESWIAVQFLGTLMVVTLIVLIWGVLAFGFLAPQDTGARQARERKGLALALLMGGVVLSAGLFLGFKNRPGAYQGSPAALMDPSQDAAAFRLDRVPVPPGPVVAPADPAAVDEALTAYGRALEELLAGYYILDRNYNYDFHNHLFLRQTPLLPDYRAEGLRRVAAGRALADAAERAFAAVRQSLPGGDPLGVLLDDVRAYTAHSFARAGLLERMTAEFEKTQAGLQHATHIYEGEGKMLGVQLESLLAKHAAVLSDAATGTATGEFERIGRSIHQAYAGRIVGF